MFFVGEKGNEMVICRKMYCIVAQPVKRFSTLVHCSFFVRLKFLREAILPLPNWRISSLYNRFVFINLSLSPHYFSACYWRWNENRHKTGMPTSLYPYGLKNIYEKARVSVRCLPTPLLPLIFLPPLCLATLLLTCLLLGLDW